ncbi:MAG: hypothetical protein ABFD16_21300 [Thermoguttaceae bacterium]
MRAVRRFESNLLRIVYGILGQAPRAEVLPLVSREMEQPRGLSRNAVELVQEALAKGCVHLLARGGWRRERFLRGERPVEGRLWQRMPPRELALTFSRNTLEFLLWLTARNPVANEEAWRPRTKEPMTTGDRLVQFLAYRAVRGTAIADSLRRRQVWAGHGLCWLAFADEFAEVQSGVPIDWQTWTTGVGACILEALQHELMDHWIQMERNKAECTRPEQMRAVGAAQQRVLDSLFDALETQQRRDLSRFVLMAAARLLHHQPSVEAWIGRLHLSGLPMGQRVATHTKAFAFLHALERLAHWQRQAVAIGYFDDGYAASQLWKADWEHWDGGRCCDLARALIRRVDPMHAAVHVDRPEGSCPRSLGQETEGGGT